MLGVGIIAPLLPIYAESMGATILWIAVISASFSLSRAIFMPFIGRASDKRGRKVFLCVGLFAYTVISLGYIWASQPLELTIVRLLHGSAAGMIIPIAQAYIGDLAPEGEEGTWMGYFNATFFAGFGCGPLIGGALTDYFGMDTAFYTMGVLNLLAFILVFLFLPDVHPKERRGCSPRPSFREMGKSSMIKGLLSFRFTNAMGRGAFITFLPILAAFSLGLTAAQIGVALALNILVAASLQPLCGRLADKFSRRKLVVIGNLIDTMTLGMIPLVQNFSQLLALCIVGSVAKALSIPAASALTVEEGKRFGMGSTMGVFTMAMSLGMAASVINGGVAELGGLDSAFYFGAGIEALGTGLFIWFTR